MKQISLTESCVFLQLSISRMGDKRGVSSEEIEVDADKDLVKVRKVIFKSNEFDRIKSLDSEVRRYVRSQCFPFENGLHLVPIKMVDMITEKLHVYHLMRNEYINDFVDVYPSLVIDANPKLRKLFNENDYRTDDIAEQFSMGWQFLMLTAPMGLEAVNSELLKQEQKKMQDRFQEAFEEARMLLRETCLNLVQHLRVSLESDAYGAAKRLSSSTVRHLQEFLNTFDLRNVTNDTELSRYISEARQLTEGIDPEALRTIDGLRNRVREELHAIEESITTTLVTQPTRRIRL